MGSSFSGIINYISIPKSEWTDDTAEIAIWLMENETKSEKLPGGEKSEKQFKKTQQKQRL